MMELKSIQVNEKAADGKLYRAEEFTLGERYEVEVYDTTYESGTAIRKIYVEAVDRNDRYLPVIYYQTAIFGESEPRFKIQTTAYGAMDIEDIQKAIAGYQEAIEAVKVLTEAFC